MDMMDILLIAAVVLLVAAWMGAIVVVRMERKAKWDLVGENVKMRTREEIMRRDYMEIADRLDEQSREVSVLRAVVARHHTKRDPKTGRWAKRV